MRITAISLVWLLAMTSGIAGQTPSGPQAPLPAGVEIRVEAVPETATVGDPIRISLNVTAPAGYRVVFPQPAAQLGEFTVLDFQPGSGPQSPAQTSEAGGENRRHHQAQIVAALYRPGKFDFSPIDVQITADDGKTFTVASPAIAVEIKSVLADENAELKDLKKQVDLPEPVSWVLWSGVALAAVISGLILWLLRRRKRPPAPAVLSSTRAGDPLALAEADLRRLMVEGLPDPGTEKRFYILLSEIAKRILEAGYGITAVERTTSEIMDSLRCTQAMAPETADRIEFFLIDCDLVKFAKYVPSKTEQQTALQGATKLLEEAKRKTAGAA